MSTSRTDAPGRARRDDPCGGRRVAAARLPAPALRRPGVRVDVGPLRANAGDPTAAWVEQFLPGQIARGLAQRGARANVSVRIDYLTLGSSTGGYGPAGSSYDKIQGVGDDRRGREAGPRDLLLLSLAGRPDDDRAVEPRAGAAPDPGARLLDRPGRGALSVADRAPPQAAPAIASQTSPTSASTSA